TPRAPQAGRMASRAAPPPSAAPVEPHDLGRAAFEIPVAAEGAHARGLGARHRDVLADPVPAVADDDVLAFHLAGDRFDHALDDFWDLEDARIALDLVDDLLGADAKKTADENLQQAGRAPGLAAEDAGQRLDGIDRGALVDEQRGGPVAAREPARDVEDQPDIDAGEVRVLVMAFLDVRAGPGVARAFGRLVLAERDHARAEDRAIAGENEIALDLPVIRHLSLLNSSDFRRPMRDDRSGDHRESDCEEDRAHRMAETHGRADLLDRHHDAEQHHPDDAHDADREHQQHHRPAAAEAIETLL